MDTVYQVIHSFLHSRKLRNGQMLVEIMVALAISALFLPALLTGIVASQEGRAQQKLRFDAVTLLKEAEVAARSVRDSGWANIEAKKGRPPMHPVINGNNWKLDDGVEQLNGFTRQVLVDDVWIDSNGNIVADDQGELDPSTLEIIATVSWTSPYNSSVSSSTYVTRTEGNTAKNDDTALDFNDGTRTSTTITTTGNGEVSLLLVPQPDWCKPEYSTSINIQGGGQTFGKTISATEGRVLTGTTGGTGFTLERINFTTNTNPPVFIEPLDTWDKYNTNEVFSLNFDEDAYVATPNNDKPVVKVRLSPAPFTEVGYFDDDTGTDADGKSVYVVGSTGYAIVGGKLWNFSTTPNPTNNRMPRLDIDGVDLYGPSATATRIIVRGDYAYVAADDSGNAFQVFDISNPNDLKRKWSLALNNRFAKDLSINATGTRAYIVTSDKNGKDPDGDGNGILYAINITNIESVAPSIFGQVGTDAMRPRGVVSVTGTAERVIVIGKQSNASKEYQVFRISQQSGTPTLCGSIDLAADMLAVAAVIESDGDYYAYVMTKDVTRELKIIQGGIGGYAYAWSGTYESGIFDLLTDVAVNRINWNFNVPVGTSLKFKVAVADAVGGSCTGANYEYVGPVKTDPDSYFTSASPLPFDNDGIGYENPGRCFRYKAFLSTTNKNLTPVLNSFSFNYSP